MLSSIFEFLAALHSIPGFDSGVTEVCDEIAAVLRDLGL